MKDMDMMGGGCESIRLFYVRPNEIKCFKLSKKMNSAMMIYNPIE
jgi:hypothetical protein